MAKPNKKQTDLQDLAITHLKRAVMDNADICDNAEKNHKAYMMEKYGNEVDGRSKFVTSDLADTIEWIMPTLMRLFYGSQYVFDVLPQGPEDVVKAKAMNSKLNFDFMQCQNGYMILHDWFKSALYNKISAVKYWWEVEENRKLVEFDGLTIEELNALTEDPSYDLEESDSTMNESDGTISLANVYEIKTKSYPKCEVIPPEEFIFEIKSKTNVADADFVAHKKRVHKNHLKSKYKLKESELEAVNSEFENGSSVEDERFEDLGGMSFLTDDEDKNFYYIYECYLNDYDKNGNPVPMKMVILGNKVIDITENNYGRAPFCTLSSIRIPHRMAGISIGDLMYDLQRLHTSLVRAIMDNVYYQNNGVNVVNPFRVNMDDVINRKEPGASWRTLHDIDPSSAIYSIQPNQIAPQTVQMLDVVSKMKERRSGVNDYGQEGLSQQTLNKTAAGMTQVMSQALERIEMLSRLFAETGVKDLANQLIRMNIDYLDQEVAVKVDENWAEITPEDIDGNFDVIVDVAVGTAAKEMRINQLMTILQTVPIGQQAGALNAENVHEMYYAIFEMMGYKIPDRFTSKPQQDPQQAQQMQQMQQQIQQLTEMVKYFQAEHDIKAEEVKIKWAKLALDEQEMEQKGNFEVQKLQTTAVMESQKVEAGKQAKTVDALVKEQKIQSDERMKGAQLAKDMANKLL